MDQAGSASKIATVTIGDLRGIGDIVATTATMTRDTTTASAVPAATTPTMDVACKIIDGLQHARRELAHVGDEFQRPPSSAHTASGWISLRKDAHGHSTSQNTTNTGLLLPIAFVRDYRERGQSIEFTIGATAAHPRHG